MTGPDLATYYDRLGIWTRLARPFGFGGGSADLTVHRLLSDPRAGGRPTATRLHDIIVESLPPLDRPAILDAGCGFGGTMLDLAVRYGGTAVGLTLSPRQAARARAAAAANGMTGRVDAQVQSYDDPPPARFDLIVAIESLAHSPNPAASVAGLAAVLAPNGWFVVVDDMPEAGAEATEEWVRFTRGWQAPVVWGHHEYRAAFERLGLSLGTDSDLTPESRLRTLPQIARMERLNRAAAVLAPRAWQVVLDSYAGGLALERLYRSGLMRYRLVSGMRKPLSPGRQEPE